DSVRSESQARKTGQPELVFGDTALQSRLTHDLRQRYLNRARAKVIDVLQRSRSNDISYSALFCEAMAFPLVVPADLRTWIENLVPEVKLRFAGSARRKKLSPEEDDHVIVVNRMNIK